MAEHRELPPTEQPNPSTRDLDMLPTEDLLRVMNAEDQTVAGVVAGQIPRIAEAVEAAAQALREGGRLIYVGAGTSGRLALLDALECPPTFNTDPEQIQAVVAGGVQRDVSSSAEFEDRADLGAQAMVERAVGPRDVVVGIAASGTTPFTVAAVEEARRRGARTVALSCVPDSPLTEGAHIAITPVVGPEVLAGSTRLKAGTAQKLVLNMLSTATMVRLGKVYQNLMVEVQPRNRKLQARAERVLALATGGTTGEAQEWLQRAEGNVKVAIIMAKTGADRKRAARLLEQAGGHVRRALIAAGEESR